MLVNDSVLSISTHADKSDGLTCNYCRFRTRSYSKVKHYSGCKTGRFLSSPENLKRQKYFRNVYCVVINHNKVQDMQANNTITN